MNHARRFAIAAVVLLAAFVGLGSLGGLTSDGVMAFKVHVEVVSRAGRKPVPGARTQLRYDGKALQTFTADEDGNATVVCCFPRGGSWHYFGAYQTCSFTVAGTDLVVSAPGYASTTVDLAARLAPMSRQTQVLGCGFRDNAWLVVDLRAKP